MQPQVTPGQSRIIRFAIEGREFCYRRPTRADRAEIAARTALKIGESEVLNRMDGFALQWEAMLEVGLVPARSRVSGKVIDLGETCPDHWKEPLYDADGKEIGRLVSFTSVDPEEFAAVVAHLDEEIKKKAPSPRVISTASASDPTSAATG